MKIINVEAYPIYPRFAERNQDKLVRFRQINHRTIVKIETDNGLMYMLTHTDDADLVIQSHNHWYQRFLPSFGGGGGDDAVPVDDTADGTVYLPPAGPGLSP